MNPDSFEAHYAKAKAKKEAGRLHQAVNDLTEALRVAPHNRDLHRVILRIKEEIAASEEKTSSEEEETEGEDESKKHIPEEGGGTQDSSTTSGVDSSTGSAGSFTGPRGDRSSSNNQDRKKADCSFDDHSTSLII